MAARKRRGASGRAKSSAGHAPDIPGGMMEGLQQIWLAGVGVLSRAQRDGPAAFQEAVTEGLKQANQTWDSLELLFQNRVQQALTRIGVPTADEVRALTRRVVELNDSVKTLSRKRAAGARRAARAKRAAARPARRRRRA